MLSILGPFPFQLATAPYETWERDTQQEWAENPRTGKRASLQHVGPGSDIITLEGTLVPEFTGGRSNLDKLRLMMDEGESWPYIDGEGYVLGFWIVTRVKEKHEFMFEDGAPRKIDFSVELKRADSTDIEKIGAVARIALSAF